MTITVDSLRRRSVLRRNLKAINADGFSFSIMVGIAETYLPAFMLARGFGELAAALIAALPVLLGSLLQLAAPWLLARLGAYRRFVVTVAALQATSVLVLTGLALAEHVRPWMVFVPATLYWAAGLAAGPAWNLWVEQLVPPRLRGGFVACRSRLCHAGVVICLISGGLLLRWSGEVTLLAFAAMFAVGAVGRFVSAAMLARQTEVLLRPEISAAQGIPDQDLSARAGLLRLLQLVRRPGADGRLVLFFVAVQTAVYVSGPYFNPFMLKVLKLSWVDYMSLLSLGFIGKMLSLPWAGRFAGRAGADRLMWVGTLGIVPVSMLWYFSQQFWYLACLQIFSGLVWGCYELAMLLQFFRQIPAQRRVALLTAYNVGNSAAMVLGTILGACVLYGIGRTTEGYLAVFVLSGCLRLAATLAMPGRRTALRQTYSAVRSLQRPAEDRSVLEKDA
ncbi:MAG: MFS transporter [Planctomyces sp.]